MVIQPRWSNPLFGPSLLTLAAMVTLACCHPGPPAPLSASVDPGVPGEVDVFLLAGQSNMEGVGRVGLMADKWLATPDVHLFHSSAIGAVGSDHQWLPLRPAGWKGTASGGFGMEMSLGSALSRAHPGRQIYLIKHAVGGTSLFRDWHPGVGPEYLTFEALVNQALGELSAKGLRPIVRGVFWQQGEADAKTPEMSHVYGRRLENFIVRTRARFAPYTSSHSGSAIRFVLGQVIPDAATGSQAHKTYPHRHEIRAAQLSVSQALGNVVTVPTDPSFSTHASSRDGYRDEDNIHFDEAGLTKLGEHMAAAFLAEHDPMMVASGGRSLPAHEPSLTNPPALAGNLRVATYNTYYVFSNGEQVDAATRWIGSQAPDLVACQELTNVSPGRLAELAAGWGHSHSALLKTSGFSVGVTSRRPLEIVERIKEGLHHGALHVQVAGIHVFVVHLSPFKWATRTAEARILLAKIQPLLTRGSDVLVLGDFNAESLADSALLSAQPGRLQKARASDAEHDHVQNLRNGQLDFSVMEHFFGAGLVDAALPFLAQSRGLRWSLPTGYWSKGQATPPTGGTRVDYILASPSLASSAVSAFTPRGGALNRISDHYPVVIEFHPSTLSLSNSPSDNR